MSIDRVAVLGSTGMLGKAIVRTLREADVDVLAGTRELVNLASESSIQRFVDSGSDAIVNCAAWTDVDGAEEFESAANEANGLAVGYIADACAELDIPLLHFSTDYVFDGRATEPYAVDHPREPSNAYGRSKLLGERTLEKSRCDWLCVRTSWLYAEWGKNFVLTMARLLHERDELRVVDDQQGRPTSVTQLADRSLDLLFRGTRGMWHVTDNDSCTWFELAKHIADLTRSPASVLPCTTAEFPRPAPRPAYSVLDVKRTDALLGPARGWKGEVRRALERAGLIEKEKGILA